MKILRYAARFAKGTLIAAAVTGTVGGALSAATLAIVADALRAGRSTTRQVLAFVAMTIAGTVLRFASTDLMTRFSQHRLRDMSRDLTHRVVASGLRQVEELGPSRLLATLKDDIVIITNAVAGLPTIMTQSVILVGCFLYVAWLSWQLWAMGTICVGVGVVTYLWIARRARALGRQARTEQDKLIGHYRALTDGFTELKLHEPRRAAFLSRVLGATLEKITRLAISASRLFNGAANYNQMMFFVVVGLLVFGSTRWTNTNAATVTSAILALLYGRGPLETLVGWVPVVVSAEIALARYEAVVAQLPAEHTGDGGGPPIQRCSRIDLVGVEYQYTADDGDRFGLGPIDLTIAPGEILFVSGGNGSGKSTLAKIIAGLYVPPTGRLRVDGEPVTDANRDQYRQLVSSTFASFHLFQELLGLERPTLDREAGDWLDRMRLTERVHVKNGVFSDLKLSTGQRKRVALLVAMLENRPICIFDEWAADQDAQYREEFYSSVLPELKARGKVVIVISHDDRYYSLGDRVIKLDRGRIVADPPAADFVSAAPPVSMLAET